MFPLLLMFRSTIEAPPVSQRRLRVGERAPLPFPSWRETSPIARTPRSIAYEHAPSKVAAFIKHGHLPRQSPAIQRSASMSRLGGPGAQIPRSASVGPQLPKVPQGTFRSFGLMAQCVVHALKGLACRASPSRAR